MNNNKVSSFSSGLGVVDALDLDVEQAAIDDCWSVLYSNSCSSGVWLGLTWLYVELALVM